MPKKKKPILSHMEEDIIFGPDEDEEKEEFDREYIFYIEGEPEIECIIGGYKVSLPISKLGLTYKKMVKERSYDTDGGYYWTTETKNVEFSHLRLELLRIKGKSKTPYSSIRCWTDVYNDIKELNNRIIKEGDYIDLREQNADNICVSEIEYKPTKDYLTINTFNKFLEELGVQ